MVAQAKQKYNTGVLVIIALMRQLSHSVLRCGQAWGGPAPATLAQLANMQTIAAPNEAISMIETHHTTVKATSAAGPLPGRSPPQSAGRRVTS